MPLDTDDKPVPWGFQSLNDPVGCNGVDHKALGQTPWCLMMRTVHTDGIAPKNPVELGPVPDAHPVAGFRGRRFLLVG